MDLPAAWVMISSKEGNGDIWLAGYGGDSPQIGAGTPLKEGSNITIPCNNLNQISLLCSQDGDEVFITAGLTGNDVNFTPSNPPSLDLIPPTLVSTSPVNGAPNQETNVLISVQMSEDMLTSSVNTTNVTVSPSFPYSVSLDSSDHSIISVLHSFNLANSTTYTITLKTGLKDLAGNSLAAQQTFSFTTKATPPPPDTTAPTIVSAWPNSGALITINDVPYITFSEAMLLSSFNTNNTNIKQNSNGQLVSGHSFSLSADLKTVYIDTSGMQGSTIYTWGCNPTFQTGPTDLAGNKTTSTLSRNFTTQSTTTTSTVYNVAGNAWHEIAASGFNHYEIKEGPMSTSSALYGVTITSYTLKLKKVGSPSGNVVLRLRNNGGGSTFTLKRTIATIATSQIGTSETTITVDDSSNTSSLVVYDQIGIAYDAGNSSNYVLVKYSNTDAFDSTRTILTRTNNSENNNEQSGWDVAMTMEGY